MMNNRALGVVGATVLFAGASPAMARVTCYQDFRYDGYEGSAGSDGSDGGGFFIGLLFVGFILWIMNSK